MDTWREYDLDGVKCFLGWLGVALIVLAIVTAIAVPSVQVARYDRTIMTYRVQALQTATPTEYASDLRWLSLALANAGMVKGNMFLNGPPHGQMEYVDRRLRAYADRADLLAELNIASTEVNTGLTELKTTLGAMHVSPYQYWLWRQGGLWYAICAPIILAVMGISGLVAWGVLPSHYSRRVTINASPA